MRKLIDALIFLKDLLKVLIQSAAMAFLAGAAIMAALGVYVMLLENFSTLLS